MQQPKGYLSYLKGGWKIGSIKEKIIFRSHSPSSVHQRGSVRTKVLRKTKMEKELPSQT